MAGGRSESFNIEYRNLNDNPNTDDGFVDFLIRKVKTAMQKGVSFKTILPNSIMRQDMQLILHFLEILLRRKKKHGENCKNAKGIWKLCNNHFT